MSSSIIVRGASFEADTYFATDTGAYDQALADAASLGCGVPSNEDFASALEEGGIVNLVQSVAPHRTVAYRSAPLGA